MSSLVEEENNKVRRFSGVYREKDGLLEFHVSKYNPVTQEFEPYGVYGDHKAFESQHRIISLQHLYLEGEVDRYYVYFVLEETS